MRAVREMQTLARVKLEGISYSVIKILIVGLSWSSSWSGDATES